MPSGQERGRLPPSQRGRFTQWAARAGILIPVAAIVGFFDPPHMTHALLAGIWLGTLLGIGALLLALLADIAPVRWLLVIRRPMEWIARSLAAWILLGFVLCWAGVAIYTEWWFVEGVAPRWFSNQAYWLRTGAFVVILIVMVTRHVKRSEKEDEEGSEASAATRRRHALPDLVLVLLTLAGMCAEWILSLHAAALDPVIVPLAGVAAVAWAFATALSVAAIALVCFERAGLVAGVWRAEDHDRLARALLVSVLAAALLGGALVFSASTFAPTMAQAWGGHFLTGSWRVVTALFLGAHAAAVVVLVSPLRKGGRGLVTGAALALVAACLLSYQLALPHHQPAGPAPFIYELVGIPIGLLPAWLAFFTYLTKRPVYPLKDRRLT